MGTDWTRLGHAKDFVMNDSYIDVQLGDGRRQRVIIEDQGESLYLMTCVARPAVVSSIPDLPLQVWTRNRASQLVGFRIDRRGRLLGEAWVPKPGLTAEEFQLYVRTVATESDRYEYMLTGKDVD